MMIDIKNWRPEQSSLPRSAIFDAVKHAAGDGRILPWISVHLHESGSASVCAMTLHWASGEMQTVRTDRRQTMGHAVEDACARVLALRLHAERLTVQSA